MLTPPSTGKKRKKIDEVETLQKENADLKIALTCCRAALAEAPRLGQHILILFVGPERQLITMHTNLIAASTAHWLYTVPARLNGLIHLVDQDPELVAIWRLYLYTGKVWSQWDGDFDEADDGEQPVHEDREWHRLMLLYVLARSLRDEAFGNKVLDSIFEKANISDRYPTDLAAEVWEHTTWGDNLRKVIIDLHVWKGQGTGIRESHADRNGPTDFLDRVRTSLTIAGDRVKDAGITLPWANSSNRCAKYHTHHFTHYCGIEVMDLTEAGNMYEQAAGPRMFSGRESGVPRASLLIGFKNYWKRGTLDDEQQHVWRLEEFMTA
ncbi:hypothetical protein CERZMDRAFT_98320 [Cercospora zeae-maydis SCOH1-5]|uniref:BTB domain-containing protein n=1 Tax=Cercospora zeae-maydis SCOH1-5 TaxID=717836 RepID=A0A6A6FDH5_9PEZI|nr:hypothetical protein CERZMDRAFT_98320 [Cercospora zeae-maydis SCOH1-5]